MFWNVIMAEQARLARRALLWVELAIIGGLSVLMVGLLLTIGPPEAQSPFLWPTVLLTMLEFSQLSWLGGMLVVVLAGIVLAQGYSWRTIPLWLSHGVPRTTLLGGILMALLPPLLLIVLTPLLLGGTLSALLSARLNGVPMWDQVHLVHLALSVPITAYTLLPYLTFTVLLAVASRSTAAALGGGIAFVIGESMLMQLLTVGGQFGAQLTQILPMTLGMGLIQFNQAILATPAAPATEAMLLPAPGVAAIGIAIYTLLFSGLSFWIFRHQDLS